ncbi:MAG: hypothetical protein KDE58_41325, partial [Caldilineaceae bacterium]|nr:hypothetical protein [Caldilineaceae bacterium]
VIGWLAGRARSLLAALGIGGEEEEATPQESDEATTRGPDTQPTVDLPFSMDDESHTITLAPTDDGDIEVFMASDRKLPLWKQFRTAHTNLDNLRRYINSIEDEDVKELFREEFGDAIDSLPANMVDEFKALYRTYFPKDEGHTPDPSGAKPDVRRLITNAEQLVARIKAWGDRYGIDGLSGPDIDETINTKGHELWKAAWEQKRLRIAGIIGRYSYKGAPVMMRGSVAKGIRSDVKAQTRFDETAFDVDMYVVHQEDFDKAVSARVPVQAGKIFPSRQVPELATLSARVQAELVREFPDVRGIGGSAVVLNRTPPPR